MMFDYGTGKSKQKGIYDPSVNPSVQSQLDGLNKVWMPDYEKISQTSHSSKAYGTGIPYLFNIYGDLLINPSTVSPSTFKKMVETDNMIGTCMRYNIDSIINTIGQFVHPNLEVQEAIRKAIYKNRRGFRVFQRDILTCLYAGFSDSEAIWDYDEDVGGDIIVETIPLPQNTLVYRIDPTGNLQEAGIGQYVFNSFFPGFSSLLSYGIGNIFQPLLGGQFNNPLPGQGGCEGYGGGIDPFASTGDLDYPYRTYVMSPIGLQWLRTDNVIKSFYYGCTNNMNPYGKSMLRDTYTLWVEKYALKQFALRAVRSKSAPLLALFGNPNIPVGDYGSGGVNDPNAFSSNNRNNPSNPIDQLRIAADQIDSTNYLLLAGMPGEIFDIKSFPNEANIDVIKDLLMYYDEMIAGSLFVPRTIFGGGGEGRGSHSLSSTHDDVHFRWVMSEREDYVENVLIKEYVRPMIEELFDESEHEGYFGDFEISVTSIDEQFKISQTFKNAKESCIIFPDDLADLNHMRKALDFEKMNDTKMAADALDAERKGSSEPKIGNREVNDKTNTPYAHNIS